MNCLQEKGGAGNVGKLETERTQEKGRIKREMESRELRKEKRKGENGDRGREG